jgi:aspartyl-tRNA(Asn)/glutamyl-tRNA(Gln) amidotransferase subunit B
VLTQRKDVADYFEAGVADGAAPKEMANWVTTELLRIVRERKLDRELVIRDWPLTASQLAKLSSLVQRGTINRNTAKGLIPQIIRPESATLEWKVIDPEVLVKEKGLGQVSDRGALDAAVADVIARHPAQVEQVKGGKTQVLGFLVGQVMKATGGKANPKVVQELLRAALALP